LKQQTKNSRKPQKIGKKKFASLQIMVLFIKFTLKFGYYQNYFWDKNAE
jgi:hypothetical protein